jgi:hypothetical protein
MEGTLTAVMDSEVSALVHAFVQFCLCVCVRLCVRVRTYMNHYLSPFPVFSRFSLSLYILSIYLHHLSSP